MNVLAGDRGPLPIWRQSNVTDGEGKSCDHLFIRVGFEGVHAHCPIFRTGEEEVILDLRSVLLSPEYILGDDAHGSCYCCIILLTIIQICRLAIGAGGIDAHNIVGSCRHQFLAVGGVCEESWTGGICLH